MCISSWSNTICWIDFPFPTKLHYRICLKSIDDIWVSLFLNFHCVPLINLSILMLIKCYLNCCYFTVIYKINCSLPNLLLLFKLIWAIRDSLHFYIKFRISLLTLTKNKQTKNTSLLEYFMELCASYKSFWEDSYLNNIYTWNPGAQHAFPFINRVLRYFSLIHDYFFSPVWKSCISFVKIFS